MQVKVISILRGTGASSTEIEFLSVFFIMLALTQNAPA